MKREAAGQSRRAANGLRSNYRAARKGRSRKEFAAKLGTASEEADECVDWLEYIRDGRIRHDPALLQEATELAVPDGNQDAGSDISTCRHAGFSQV